VIGRYRPAEIGAAVDHRARGSTPPELKRLLPRPKDEVVSRAYSGAAEPHDDVF
jgi:hypothetical protein